MKKNFIHIFILIATGISFVLGYILISGIVNWNLGESKDCLASGKWQLKSAHLDSFLYMSKPREIVPPKLLSSIDITDSLIGSKEVQLELKVEERGSGLYGEAIISYKNTPYTIHYSASASGSKRSKSCKSFINLSYGIWHKNGQEIWDTNQYLNNITIKNIYSKNYCSAYKLRNDSLFSIIDYNGYDQDSSYYPFVNLNWAQKYRGGNKTLYLLWIKIDKPLSDK
jgi:hypothetical protein